MPSSGKRLLTGGVIALTVAASWVATYRMGSNSGQDLAIEVTGVPLEEVASPTPPARPPLPTRVTTAGASIAPPPSLPRPQLTPVDPLPAEEAAAAPSPEAVDRLLAILADTRGQGLLNLRLSQAVQDLGLADVPRVIDELAALPAGPKRDAGLLAVVGRWAELEPEEAIGYAVGETIPVLRTRMIQSTFAGWALTHPTAALAYLEQNPDWPHQETAARALFEAVAERPAADAFHFLESVDEETQGALMHRTISRLLTLDPLAVRQWAEGLPESQLRDSAVTRSITAWADYSPVEAKDWIMENYEGEALSVQLPRLAGAWARNDPEAARDWYLDLPGELRTARVGEEVFESWLREDHETARAYLDGTTPRAELDQGFKEYAYQVQRENPSQAMDLTAKIIDEKTRSDTQSRVARYWAQRNPRAVLGYLETSSIPVEDQAPLIRYAESRLKQQTHRNRR